MSPAATAPKDNQSKVSYANLPNKTKLAVLCLARLADPLASTSINSYLFFQLSWFNPSASSGELAAQAGLLVGAKTAAQVCTNLVWGKISDSSSGGRKAVLIIGLACSGLALIGYGFARSFIFAILCQVFAGAMSNNVSIVRCVVAELNPEKKYRSRALLLLPLFANAGQLLGPLLGGLLSSNTITTGPDGAVEGFPYLLPNLIIAVYHFVVAVLVLFFLDETLPSYDPEQNVFLRLSRFIKRRLGLSAERSFDYETLQTEDTSPTSDNHDGLPHEAGEVAPAEPVLPKPPTTSFRSLFTVNVCCTMLSHFIITGHLGTFTTLWVVFLSTPIDMPSSSPSFLAFSGGVGLLPRSVGLAMSFTAAASIFTQMIIYPILSDRFSTVRIWRASLLFFPLCYLVAPFPALIATVTNSTYATSPGVWAMVATVLLLFTAGRSGVTPATTLLINDCVPAPDARGRINSLGTTVGNLSRSIFPVLALAIYGWGLQVGVVGIGFWCLAVLAVLAIVASQWVKGEAN